MKSFKLFLFVVFSVCAFTPNYILAVNSENFSDEEVNRAIENAKSKKNQIEAECKRDPYVCSCEVINCEEILGSNDMRAKTAYDKCVSEKSSCEDQRREGIRQMETQKAAIESACRKDLNRCNCSIVTNEEGRKKCELAIIEAKYQAEKERVQKMNSCMADMDNCDCGTIEDENGKKECEQKLAGAKELREKMKKACRENLGACDCTIIESEQGKNECETKKKEAMTQAGSEIKLAFSKCFKDVENCKCGELGIKEQGYVDFCELQKSYGMSCKKEGMNCDKLDAIEIYPAGMPVWLGKLFAGSYKEYIESEKQKGLAEAANIVSACIRTPDKCECDKTPTYARSFCERNRSLQKKCLDNDYNACILLDKSPNLPEGTPVFSFGPLDRLINGLRQMQSGFVQGNAARRVGNMMMDCMSDVSKCDCSIAPSGPIKSFCENKKLLVGRCLNDKNYDACFSLSEGDFVPSGTPDVISDYIKSNVVPKMKEKEQQIFDRMKKGTTCERVKTISECKILFKTDNGNQ